MSKPIEQRLYDADRAREVLENEAFQRAFADVEQEITDEWKKSPARDAEGREKLWQYLSMLRKVKAQLETTLATGELAKAEVNHKSWLQNVRSLVA